MHCAKKTIRIDFSFKNSGYFSRKCNNAEELFPLEDAVIPDFRSSTSSLKDYRLLKTVSKYLFQVAVIIPIQTLWKPYLVCIE